MLEKPLSPARNAYYSGDLHIWLGGGGWCPCVPSGSWRDDSAGRKEGTSRDALGAQSRQPAVLTYLRNVKVGGGEGPRRGPELSFARRTFDGDDLFLTSGTSTITGEPVTGT